MRTYLNERNIVIALFIVVLITFSLAQEDSRKFDKKNATTTATTTDKASSRTGTSQKNILPLTPAGELK